MENKERSYTPLTEITTLDAAVSKLLRIVEKVENEHPTWFMTKENHSNILES